MSWNQRPRICLVAKFDTKIKILKFGTENALFWYFWPAIWKNCCHIWNQHPQICLIANFAKKPKMYKFETKNVWFRYFWAWNLKRYCHQHLPICLIVTFFAETKMLKFGTKNALICVSLTKTAVFGYFWARIFLKNYRHIWNHLSFSNWKISGNNENV